MREISQKIKKGIRGNKRSQRHEKVQNILEEFKGIKSIADNKTRKKNILLTQMRNEAGDIEATRKGVANTFAKFYEDLYSSRNDARKDEEDNEETLEDSCDRGDDDETY